MEPTSYPIPTLLQTTLSMVVFFFPMMLYAVWATLAFADLGRRQDLSSTGRAGWSAVILLFPWIGAAFYHLAGRSGISGPVRTAMIGGGITVYLAFLLLGRLIGGIS